MENIISFSKIFDNTTVYIDLISEWSTSTAPRDHETWPFPPLRWYYNDLINISIVTFSDLLLSFKQVLKIWDEKTTAVDKTTYERMRESL